MDLSRAKLIRDLKNDLGVNDEGVGVILNLLDQMHGLRRALAELLQSARERSAPADDPSSMDQGQGRK
jgi:chaperone modulatory protein CbpM